MSSPIQVTVLKVKWYQYLFAFLSGVFLMNFLPHFINGICGNYFPTPFANPPGKGLSSPILNIVWAAINLCIGGVFFYVGRVNAQQKKILGALLLGSLLMAFFLASYFGKLFHP